MSDVHLDFGLIITNEPLELGVLYFIFGLQMKY